MQHMELALVAGPYARSHCIWTQHRESPSAAPDAKLTFYQRSYASARGGMIALSGGGAASSARQQRGR